MIDHSWGQAQIVEMINWNFSQDQHRAKMQNYLQESNF